MSPVLLSLLLVAFAQEPTARPDAAPREQAARDDDERQDERASDEKGAKKEKEEKEKPEEPPVVTSHELRVGTKVLKYKVTTGFMPLKNEEGKTEARIFFMAYVADRTGPQSARPLMFSFNGGPGSSSVWLHLGALGPKRVKMLDDG